MIPRKNKLGRVLAAVFLAMACAATLMPIVLTVIHSFMSKGEVLKYFGYAFGERFDASAVVHIIPDQFTLNGYYQILFRQPDYLYKFWISIMIAAAIAAGQTVIGCLGGYAFAKFRFPLQHAFFALIIILMVMPLQVTLVPNYIVLARLKLIGSYWAVILPGVFTAFGVFLMRQIMITVPDELIQAGKVDGARALTIFTRIVLPCCKAGIASLFILSFVDAWNMVEQPLIFLQNNDKYPLSVFLMDINANPGVAFACGVLSILPVLLMFLMFEDNLIKGIEYSVIK